MQRNPLRASSKLFHAVVAVLVLTSITLPGIARVSGRTKQDPHPNEENVKVIPDGTEFTVVTTEEISSKTASEGDQLSFKVLEDVAIDGHVVIAKDTLVKGVVATAKKAGQKNPNHRRLLGFGSDLASRMIFEANISSTSIREDCCS